MNEIKQNSLAAVITASILSGAGAGSSSAHPNKESTADLRKSRIPATTDLGMLSDTLTAMHTPGDVKLAVEDSALLPSPSLGAEPGPGSAPAPAPAVKKIG